MRASDMRWYPKYRLISNWRVLSLNFVILINLKFYLLLFSFYKNVII